MRGRRGRNQARRATRLGDPVPVASTLPTGATLVTDEETLIVGITGEVEQDLGDEPETEETAEAEDAAEGDDAAAEESE